MVVVPQMSGDLVTRRMDELRREMDRIFDRMWPNVRSSNGTSQWVPPVDVVETDDEIRVAVELPGIRPEDINLTVEDNVLTLSGERRREHEESKDGEYRLFERHYGRFERSFSLPQTVDAEGVRAQYKDGILNVVLPKTEEAKPRRIPIEGAGDARQIEAA